MEPKSLLQLVDEFDQQLKHEIQERRGSQSDLTAFTIAYQLSQRILVLKTSLGDSWLQMTCSEFLGQFE